MDVLVVTYFSFHSVMSSTEITIDVTDLSNSEDVEQPDIDSGRNWQHLTTVNYTATDSFETQQRLDTIKLIAVKSQHFFINTH